jgi:hypothetical protein
MLWYENYPLYDCGSGYRVELVSFYGEPSAGESLAVTAIRRVGARDVLAVRELATWQARIVMRLCDRNRAPACPAGAFVMHRAKVSAYFDQSTSGSQKRNRQRGK